MPKIATVIIGDGRLSYLRESVESFKTQVSPVSDYHIMVNDSGDPSYASQLDELYPGWHLIHHPERRGLGAAVRSAWSAMLETDADFIFHCEEDFIYPIATDLLPLTQILEYRPHLSQLVLKRQPWSPEELAAGDVFERAPFEYYDHTWTGLDWLEHLNGNSTLHVFSFNPFLAPREVIELAVSDDSSAMLERDVTDLLREHNYNFGFYGNRNDAPRCWHIGVQRSAGYRW